jgi:transaldolase/glucose-6-phosphate isomerase
VEDIRAAADLFAPLYEQTNGGDGYVSIEVSPFLAGDTEATAAQAEQLWARVARPNLMVKIPATPAGIPAIRRTVAAGLNINITLIFSRSRYAEVMEAYLSGLEDRLSGGRPIGHIASVASFFVSRVDTKVDGQLPPDSPLRGRVAVANAKLAYEDFLQKFSGDRWERLRAQGAHVQRPLWASTSTKNPAYSDTLYVDNLVGPDTINTMPPQTLEATLDHARVEVTVTRDTDGARDTIAELGRAGISLDTVTQELEIEGVSAFSEAITSLLKTIDDRRASAVRALGPLSQSVAMRISQLQASSVPSRLWAHDPTLWSTEPAGQTEASKRMGWTDSAQKARRLLPAYRDFATQTREADIDRVLVLGMGGSSLTAEVLSELFPDTFRRSSTGKLGGESVCLGILDSTSPDEVARAANDFPPDHSLYIVASKSGGTAEVTAMFDYFWSLAEGDGSRFVATTDPGTSLEQLARRLKFRRIFTADPMVGGRYSALTDFGLVPAAMLGIDLDRLLDRAEWMQRQCARELPAARNPGVTLGAVLGEAALAGRDKLTLLADRPLRPLAQWIEQLVAESSGKNGRGIVPLPVEPLDAPQVYGGDRLFVYFRQSGELDAGMEALRSAGFPVVVIPFSDGFDAGAEFLRWEIAVVTACHILSVNAFDQPDVQESKDRTTAEIRQYRSTGSLVEGAWDLEIKDLPLGPTDSAKLSSFAALASPGEYFAINAYLPRDPQTIDALQRMRVGIRERTHVAVTTGFGPRFQHSTGQLQKGGPNSVLILQIVSDPVADIEIPSEGMTFGTLIRTEALGDYETLKARGRRVFRVHLSRPDQVGLLARAMQ